MQRALVAAEASRGTSLAIDLGPERPFTVAEAVLWAARHGPRYAAEVCERIRPESACHKRVDGKIADVAKAAQAVRVANNTPASVKKFLLSDVFGKRPGLVNRGTAAAAAEKAADDAAAHAVSELADLKEKASFFEEALLTNPCASLMAGLAGPDSPLRQGMIARARLDESDRRQLQHEEQLELGAALDLSMAEARGDEAGLLSPGLLSLSPGLLLPELPLGELAGDAGLLELLVEDVAPSRPTTWRAVLPPRPRDADAVQGGHRRVHRRRPR